MTQNISANFREFSNIKHAKKQSAMLESGEGNVVLPPVSSMALDLAGEDDLDAVVGPGCKTGLVSPTGEKKERRRPSRIEILLSNDTNGKQLPVIQSPMNMGSPVQNYDKSRLLFGNGRSPQPQRANQNIIKSEIAKKLARRSITQLQGEDSNVPVLSIASPTSPVSKDVIKCIAFTSPEKAFEPESRMSAKL